jgi:hypothetical protein
MLGKIEKFIKKNSLTSLICLILLLALLLGKNIYVFGNDLSCDGWFYYGYSLDPGSAVHKINNLNLIQYQFSRYLLWLPLFFFFKISQILNVNNFLIIPQIILVIIFSFLINKMILGYVKNNIYSLLLSVIITTSPLILHSSTNANLFIQPFASLIFGYLLFDIFDKIYFISKAKKNNSRIPRIYNYILFFILFFSYFVTAYFFFSISIFLFFFYAYLLKKNIISLKEIFFPILITLLISILFFFIINVVIGISSKNILPLLISQLRLSTSSTNIFLQYSYSLDFKSFLRDPFLITFSILIFYFFLLNFYNLFLKKNIKYEFLIFYLLFVLPVIFFHLILFLFVSHSFMNDKSSIHLLVYFFFIFFYFLKYSETKNLILYKIYVLILILFLSLILQFILLPLKDNILYNLFILFILLAILFYTFFKKFFFFSEIIVLLLFLFGSYYTRTAWMNINNQQSTYFVKTSFDWLSKNNIRSDSFIFNEQDSSIKKEKGVFGSKYIALYRALGNCGYDSILYQNNLIEERLLIDKNSVFRFLLVGFGGTENTNNFYENKKYKTTILYKKYSSDLDLLYYEIKFALN